MLILSKDLTKCKACHKLRGTIEEKYNGTVPVYCKCDLRGNDRPHFQTACICIGGENTDAPRIIWKPCSDSKDENGEWWHTPYFAGPSVW